MNKIVFLVVLFTFILISRAKADSLSGSVTVAPFGKVYIYKQITTIEKKFDFPAYVPPVIMGYSSGATLVYGILKAQKLIRSSEQPAYIYCYY